VDRRVFLTSAVGFTASQAAITQPAQNRRARRRTQVVAFDGFPVIDSRLIALRAEQLFPGKGDALMTAWRTRQFEYTWLRTLSGRYQDFWHTSEDALIFAAKSIGVSLDDQSRENLMGAYLELKAWPDVRGALESLRAAGIRLVFLSNLTARMLDAAVKNSGLQQFFEPHLSTDRVRAYKPLPKAYEMALRAFGVAREDVVFCASASWDVAGAKWFGYPTFWVNRAGQPAEELGVDADGVGTTLADLVSFVLGVSATE